MEILNDWFCIISSTTNWRMPTKPERLVRCILICVIKNKRETANWRTLVVRKIKANQQKELLGLLSSSTNTEKENKEFVTEIR